MHRACCIATINKKHIGALIDNRKEEPILLIEENDVVNSKVSHNVYVKFFGGDKNMEVTISSIFKIELKINVTRRKTYLVIDLPLCRHKNTTTKFKLELH